MRGEEEMIIARFFSSSRRLFSFSTHIVEDVAGTPLPGPRNMLIEAHPNSSKIGSLISVTPFRLCADDAIEPIESLVRPVRKGIRGQGDKGVLNTL